MIKLRNLVEATHMGREVETLPGIFVDREIAKHIKILNLLGYHTKFSCSGISSDHPYSTHGKNLGYVLFDTGLYPMDKKRIYSAAMGINNVISQSIRGDPCIYFKEYYVEVFKNPTTREISYCMKDNSEIAALLTEKDIYVWDRDRAIHSTVINQLGDVVSRCLPINIQMKDDPTVDIYVTLVSSHKVMMDKNPQIQSFILKHPFFKRRRVESISFWNDGMTECFNESKKPNNRLGRCYELSGRYVSGHPESILVHGKITNPFAKGLPEVEHSWVEDGNEIFDPVMDLRWPKNVYEDFFKAKIYKKYSFMDTIKITDKTGNWGPWES